MTDSSLVGNTTSKFVWLHLGYATILSLLVPFLGMAYLGIGAGDRETEWRQRSLALFLILIGLLLVQGLLDANFLKVLAAVAGWFCVGLISVFCLWRAVRRNTTSINVVRGWFVSAAFVLQIAIFSWGLQFNLPRPDLVFISAPNNTPNVTTGETLLGLEYDPYDIRVQRGQLVVAEIDHMPQLVRVIAIPGDILSFAESSIQINAATIRLVDDGRKIALGDLVEQLGEPDQDLVASISDDGSVDFGTDGVQAPSLVRPRRFVVAFDNDIVNPRQGVFPLTVIHQRDIVSLPWAKLWSLSDHPGKYSDLAQPSIVFTD